jgi:UDPglucose--hexose-1-phosphate uridylyltransferase
MHETRYDWLADRWVIFAPNREERPNEFKSVGCVASPSEIHNPSCPFCKGFEHSTPSPTLVLPHIDLESSRPLHREGYAEDRETLPSWLVRVVPNKFPAMAGNSGLAPRAKPMDPISMRSAPYGRAEFESESEVQTESSVAVAGDVSHLFRSEHPSGCHEVVIESPNHVASLASMPTEHIELVLEAYRKRLLHWRSHSNIQFAVVFKNFGADAGASLSHTHSQIICLDFVPSDVQRIHQRLVKHHEEYGCCYICQVMHEEVRQRDRIVMETEHFVVICPFASRFPFAFSIIPRRHRPHFEDTSAAELLDLATVLKSSLSALERAQPEAAYNYVLQSSPFHQFDDEAHHWRLRVIPRLSKVAGFEWGSDCFINTIKPEVAARILREHLRP